MGILRVSRSVYEEVIVHIYERKSIPFTLRPRYVHDSWMQMRNSNGACWKLKNSHDLYVRGLEYLPWAKLQKIRISIWPPDLSDPGQLVCLLAKVNDITEMLLNAENKGFGLPSIVCITFRNSLKTPESCWVTTKVERVAQQSSMTKMIFQNYYHHLQPSTSVRLRSLLNKEYFRTLRISDIYTITNFYAIMQTIRIPPTRSQTLPLDLNRLSLQIICEKCLKSFMYVDDELDTLQCKTARMMRLHRFAIWHPYKTAKTGPNTSSYLAKIKRIYQTRRCRNILPNKTNNRHKLALCLNPLSDDRGYLDFIQRGLEDLEFQRPPGGGSRCALFLTQWETMVQKDSWTKSRVGGSCSLIYSRLMNFSSPLRGANYRKTLGMWMNGIDNTLKDFRRFGVTVGYISGSGKGLVKRIAIQGAWI